MTTVERFGRKYELIEGDLPSPRVQLCWEDNPDPKETYWKTLCWYELVIPATRDGVGDIRTDGSKKRPKTKRGGNYTDGVNLIVVLSCTKTTVTKHLDIPFRDGCHAKWDAEELGGLPIIVHYDGQAWKLLS